MAGTILVALDGSEGSERALAAAEAHSRLTNSDLYWPTLSTGLRTVFIRPRNLRSDIHAASQKLLVPMKLY